MSGSLSDNPNAPKIPHRVYLAEKALFAGTLINSILYGVAAVLFFRSMKALLNPPNRAREEIKWPFVAHTVAMFSSLTIYVAMNLQLQSLAYVDNREFSDYATLPGPIGYQLSLYSSALNVVPNTMTLLNQWLTDGLLLYRCYVIYTMNYWVIAFPFLMYLASMALGTTLTYYEITQSYPSPSINIDFGAPYYSISLALNLLLTFMIVGRLIVHSREVRSALGSLVTVGGFYRTIVTMLIESCALYAASLILYIGAWAVHSPFQFAFMPILAGVQVIAPLLIVMRVADKRALTSDAISGTIGTIRFRSQGDPTAGNVILPVQRSTNSTDANRKMESQLGVEAETAIGLHSNNV